MTAAEPVVILDHAELVLIAAEVLGADPDDVIATADVGVLSGIATRLRTITDVADAAAEVLVGIAAGRPFDDSDLAVAWLAAVMLIERNGCTVGDDDDRWVQLVRGAADGSLGERAVAAALARRLRRCDDDRGPRAERAARAGRARRLLATVCAPRAHAVPESYPCPSCGAEVERAALWSFPVYAVPSRIELVAACARQRATHDRTGTPVPERRERPVARSYPVVLGRADHGVAPFVALTDRGPLAFRPVDGGRRYEVLAVDELRPSHLTGSWSELWSEGRLVDRVPATACRLYEGAHLDWPPVAEALDAAALVPA